MHNLQNGTFLITFEKLQVQSLKIQILHKRSSGFQKWENYILDPCVIGTWQFLVLEISLEQWQYRSLKDFRIYINGPCIFKVNQTYLNLITHLTQNTNPFTQPILSGP